MYDGKRILGIIPARGGSKGIPGKNIKELNGHPLIAYTIAAARRSAYIDEVVVSTDSLEISEVAKRYGASVPFLRPAELAGDTAKSIDALLHAVSTLKNIGQRYDAVVLLQPTSPLRNEEQIDGAIETFFSHGMLGLASICQVSENPILTRRLDSSGILHPLLPFSSTVRRQDMPAFYHVDGSIYINRVEDLSPDTSLNDNPIGYITPRERSIDIDCLDDFKRAEEIVSALGDLEPTSEV